LSPKEQKVEAKELRESLVDQFKGDKKSQFNRFLIALGSGILAQDGSKTPTEVLGKALIPAFDSYLKAEQQDKKNILEATKLRIAEDNNKLLNEVRLATLGAKQNLTTKDMQTIISNAPFSPLRKRIEKQVIEGLANKTITLPGVENQKFFGRKPDAISDFSKSEVVEEYINNLVIKEELKRIKAFRDQNQSFASTSNATNIPTLADLGITF
jgi:hypothetical protein